MTGTVSMNTPEAIWWFVAFPILTAVVLAYIIDATIEWWRGSQAKIDQGLAFPLVFDQDHVHCCESHCTHPLCVAYMAGLRSRIRAKLDTEIAALPTYEAGQR